MADMSREESKRLRAELAEGLGYYPASLAPKTSLATASRSRSARPASKPVNAMAGSWAATSGTSGITSKRKCVGPRWRLAAVPMWPTSTSERHRRD